LLPKRVIVSGFPYNASSWSRMTSIVIVEFHPVRLGVFDTLNWLEIESSSILKHAQLMFLKDR
jgi:hypothetical protein